MRPPASRRLRRLGPEAFRGADPLARPDAAGERHADVRSAAAGRGRDAGAHRTLVVRCEVIDYAKGNKLLQFLFLDLGNAVLTLRFSYYDRSPARNWAAASFQRQLVGGRSERVQRTIGVDGHRRRPRGSGHAPEDCRGTVSRVCDPMAVDDRRVRTAGPGCSWLFMRHAEWRVLVEGLRVGRVAAAGRRHGGPAGGAASSRRGAGRACWRPCSRCPWR